MKTFRLFILSAAAICACGSAFAQAPVEVQQQRLEKDHRMVFFGEGTADSSAYTSLISRFYMDQFRHAQDPRAPYFMLMSRSGNLAMGIGGKISALGMYDWHGAIDGTDFTPYTIPMSPDYGSLNEFQTSIAQSAIFFSVFGNNKRFGDFQLYIEAKFSGPKNTFKLSKAYATVNDWTLGLTKSTFVDPGSQPSTVETEGPNSEVDDTRFLLRYMHTWNHRFTAAISAEQPDYAIPDGADWKAGSVYMPDFAAFVQLQWGKQHVRLSGIVKPMRYRDLIASKNHYVTGWGVNLTTMFRPVTPLTVYGAVNTGAGIGSMVNDLSCGVNGLIGLADKPGEMYAPRSFGWYGALQYNYSPSVFTTIIYSQERMLPRHTADWGPTDYKYGQYITANVFWNITPRCQTGAEVNVGRRTDMDGHHRADYRVGLLAEFSF